MDLYTSWACLLSAHRHGSVRPILQRPSSFIFILFSCPLHPFWSVIIEKGDQMGWRLKIYGLTVQGLWVDGSRFMGWRPQKTRLMVQMRMSSAVQASDKLSWSHYGTWHVSFFDWFLSRIEASLRLPCTFPINTRVFSSHFFIFSWNILSEHHCHPCQTTPFILL